VTLEENSHAQIHPFLASIAEPTPITLRSITKGKGKEPSPPRMEPENVLPHTPLSELTTSGLETEQIWEQLELRAPGYIKVAKEIISAGGQQPMNDDEEDELEEEEQGSDEEDDVDEEEMRKMFEDGELGDLTDEQFEEMMRMAEEEEEGEGSDDEEESGSELGSDDDDDEDEDDEGDSLEGSDEDGEIEFEDGTKIGDSDDDLLDDDEDEDDEEEDDDDEDLPMGSDEEISLDGDAEEEQAGPSRRRRHPTLDDQFFSIDDFNRMTEEAEATSLSSGRLDDDEDEELDEDVGQLMLNGVGDDEGMSILCFCCFASSPRLMTGIMYTDFFDAPRTVEKPLGKSKKAKVMEPKGKKGKKGKGVSFDEEPAEEDGEDDAREVMGRFKEDLFADDDEEEEASDQRMFHLVGICFPD